MRAKNSETAKSPKDVRSLLVRLAERVQDLFLETQSARPSERGKLYLLYQEAYLAHRLHKVFLSEQEDLLAA